MIRFATISVFIALAAASSWLAIEAAASHHVASRLRRAEADLAERAAIAAEISRLRAQEQRIEASSRPARDLIARVTQALEQARVPSSRFKSLVQESDVALAPGAGESGGSGLRRQALRLTLDDVSVAELGEFLQAWRAAQRVWAVTEIALAHPERGGSANSGSGQQYRATMLITALYAEEPEGGREDA